ncbi:hypothetical protein BH10BDE1_BH10BDE1_26620 [soil metagenome]
MKQLIVCVLVCVFAGFSTANANVCNLIFDDANPELVQRDLQRLDPLRLDYSNYKRSMQSLLGNVAELREDWAQLTKIERDFISDKITREQAVDAAKDIRESIAARAHSILKKDTYTQRERETLEAYKLFLNQTSKLNQASKEDLRRKYEPRKEGPKPESRREQGAEKEDGSKPGEKQNSKAQNPDKTAGNTAKKISDPKDRASKAETENSNRLADDEDMTERPSEERVHGEQSPQTSTPPAPKNEKSNSKKSDPTDKMKKSAFDDKFKPKPFADQPAARQKQNPSGEKPAEKTEKTDAKPAEGKPNAKDAKPSEGKSGEGKPDAKDAEPSEGKPSDGKPGEGKPEAKPGDGKPGEGKPDAKDAKPGEGKPGEGKPGEGKPGEGKPGEGKPGEGQSSKQDSDKAERKNASGEGKAENKGTAEAAGPQSDGEREGSSSLGQKISDKMSDFFKSLIDEAKEKIDRPKSDEEKQSDLESAQAERDEIGKRVRESQKKFEDAGRGVEAEPGARRKFEDDNKFDFDPSKRKRAEKSAPMRALSTSENAAMLKAVLENALTNVLKNYQHQDKMMTALGQLKTMAQTLYSEHAEMDFLKQFSLEVEAIRERLEVTQVSYKKLEDLGLSMIGGFEAGATNIQRKLQYLDTLYTELGKRRGKSDSEDILHDLVKRILNSIGDGGKASDQQLGEAFIAQLTGPLSKRVILQTYASEVHTGGINWKKLADDIRGSKLDDLLIYPKLKPYMKMLLNQSMTPKDSIRPNGERVPINENAPELELAQELDRFQFFHRDGAPTDVELMRFISGDMLESTFFADKIHRDPKTLRPRKVSIILYDISGSMGSQNKFVVRNALIGAYIDQTQIEVAAGREEHVVLTVAFDGQPHAPERMNTIQQAQGYFEKLRAHPIGSGGSDSITAAVANVFDLIAEQESTGALDRATVLLLTDAVATVDFDVIETARKKVSKDVDLRLNAVTMGDLNNDVQKLIEMQGGEGKGKLGVVSHQHISYEEVAAILNSKARLELLEDSAKLFQQTSESTLSKEHVIKIKNQLVSIEEKANMDDQGALAQQSALIRALGSRSGTGDDPVFNSLLKSYFRVVNTASGGWNKSTKLSSFVKFVDQASKELKVDTEALLQKMSPEDSDKLSNWIGL